jgi:tetratricopeptide (TPR) repeat protein
VLCKESLALFRAVGDLRGTALMSANVGQLAIARGEYDHADGLCGESLLISRELGDLFGVAFALVGVAEVAQCLGRFPEAQAMFQEAWSISADIGEKGLVAFCINQLAKLAHQTDDLATSEELSTEALADYEELNDRHGIAAAHTNLGDVALARAEFGNATTHFRAVLARADDLPGELIAPAFEGLSAVALASGNLTEAARALDEADRVRKESGASIPPSERASLDRIRDELERLKSS